MELKTLDDFTLEDRRLNRGEGILCCPSNLREEAIKILKTNKEINTADWIEFFNIEKEFADECLNDVKSASDKGEKQ